jgi:hypothetical protein
MAGPKPGHDGGAGIAATAIDATSSAEKPPAAAFQHTADLVRHLFFGSSEVAAPAAIRTLRGCSVFPKATTARPTREGDGGVRLHHSFAADAEDVS